MIVADFRMKKKFLLFILASLFAITQGAWAEETPQAIWCESNTTLYFINSETVYAAGDTYDGQTVTNVWSGTDVTNSSSNIFPSWFWEYIYQTCTRVVFDESFASVRPITCGSWFAGFWYLTAIEGIENLNTSEVTSMDDMFNNCQSLTSLDLSNFNTAKVTDMSFMFSECSQLETIYVGNDWTVDNVEMGTYMFSGCTSLKGGQGTTYNENKIDKEYAHIDGGESNPGYLTLKTTPQVIWCESNTTLYFINSETLYEAGDTYDGQTVTNVYSGEDVTASPIDDEPAFVMDLWDVCTRAVIDKSFASVRPTSCYSWFGDFHCLTTIEGLEYLNTSEVTNMTYMFGYCPQLTSLDLSNFNTTKVTQMIAMFNGCRALETIYVSDGWTVDNVTESRLMFGQCYSLVGGQGTTYPWDNPNAPDKTYAHIDGGESNPGFLTQLFNIALNENSDDNNATISEYNGKPCKVTLARSIVPGSYNTLSLPFDVDNALLKEKFGEDVELAELSGTHMDNETLYFDFAPADAITAGVPYLIYVSDAVESPITFNAVTVKEETQPVTTSLADFIPVFDVTTLDNGNENILFLGANNTLFYPSTSSGAMKGFRAYFKVKGEAQGAKAMVMMDNSLTGVKTILNENLQNEQVYDLQGRMVTRPAKGLYIMNGKKVIIK